MLEAGRLHPDLVVLDVQLPDTTGFDVSRQIVGDGLAGRVVLVSSRAAAEYGELIDDSGAVGFITKDELSSGASWPGAGERSARCGSTG